MSSGGAARCIPDAVRNRATAHRTPDPIPITDYKTQVAERYVPFAAQATFAKEVVRRLERIEDLLHRQFAPPVGD